MSELAEQISEAVDATTNHAEVIDRVIAEYGVRAVSPSPTNKDSGETDDSGEMKTNPLSPNLKVS